MMMNTSIIHENVYTIFELRHDLIPHPENILPIRDIGFHSQTPPTKRFNGPNDLTRFLGLFLIIHDHISAFLRQLQRDPSPDSP
jgi:hypothetical protein